MRPSRAARALPSPSPLSPSPPGRSEPRRPCRAGALRRAAAAALVLLAGALLALPPEPAHAQTEQIVENDWALKPAGVGISDSFRLLFVTSTRRNASSGAIGDYNTFVQGRANAGHTAIRSFSGEFRALISTQAVHARDNTATHPNAAIPIYWLSGAKVADDYADFYDGTWDSNSARTDSGAILFAGGGVWTGSNSNGTRHFSRPARPGNLSIVVFGTPTNSGDEIDGGATNGPDLKRLYALSPVIRVTSQPGKVTGVMVDQVTHDSMRVRWTKPSEASARPITSFGINTRQRNAADTGWEAWVFRHNPGASATSHVVTGLPSGARQQVRVFARAEQAGESTLYGADSDYIEFTTPTFAPGAPAAPTVSDAVNDSAVVSWSVPSHTGATAIHDYDVDVRPAGATDWSESIPGVHGTHRQFRLTGYRTRPSGGGAPQNVDLMPSTGYEVRVRANNREGSGASATIHRGAWSPVTSFTTSLRPGRVTGVTVDQVTHDSMRVRWTKPAEAATRPITSFGVNTRVRNAADTGWESWDFQSSPGASATSYTVTGLPMNTRHQVRVFARAQMGTDILYGPESDHVEFTTLSDTTAPTLSTATVSGATLTLTYDEALDTGSVPAGSAFTVTVAGSMRPLATTNPVSVAGRTVTLSLASAVTVGQTVTVSYTVPGTNPLQDAAGNGVAALNNRAVTDATPGLVLSVSSLTVVEGSSATYTVRLAAAPTDTVTVTVARASGGSTDVTFDQDTLTFTTGNWSTVQTVTVSAAEDADLADDSATLAHTASGGGYGAQSADLPVTVTDDDAPPPVFDLSTTTATVTEGGAINLTLTKTDPAAAGAFTPRFKVRGGGAFGLRDGNYADDPQTIALAEGTWTTALPTENDARDEANGSLTITLLDGTGYTAGSSDTITVTVHDDDRAPDAPPAPTVTGDYKRLEVAWSAPAEPGWSDGTDGSHTDNAVSYDLRYRATGTTGWFGALNRTSPTTLSRLARGTEYEVQVQAKTQAGDSAYSRSGTGTTASTGNRPPPAPTLADRTATEDTAFSYTFAAVADPDGETVSYTATGLPEWLSFDAASRTFSGTPLEPHTPSTHTVRVTATDNGSPPASSSATLRLTVPEVNDPPSTPVLSDRAAAVDVAFSYVPRGSGDPDGDEVTYSATGLPSWMSFEAATRTFSGTPAQSNLGERSAITMTASDGTRSSSATFTVTVRATLPRASIGRIGFADEVPAMTTRTYGRGEHIDVSVLYDERVTVDTHDGRPRLALTIGSRTRHATYLASFGFGTTWLLSFRYTVQGRR